MAGGIFKRPFTLNEKCIVFLQNKHNLNYLKKNKILKNNKIYFTKGSGVNLNNYKPSKKRFKKITITLPSRMSSEKGIYEFVEASRRFYKHNRNVKFILLGKFDPEGPSAIPLKKLKEYNDKKKYPNLEWMGYKKEISGIINKSTIIVLPSHHEGVPKVLMEAAACGKPIVATNISGCKEVVTQNKNGILIIDDYGSWKGAKKAVDEYFEKKPFLIYIDHAARLLIKNF